MATLQEVHKFVTDNDITSFVKAIEANPSLLSKADADGRTPIFWALSEVQNMDIVAEILKVGKNPESKFDINHADEAGYTALHIGAALGSPYTTPLLPSKPKIDVETNNKQTPMYLAVTNDHPHAVRFLLKEGANVGHKDIRQITPLMRAAAIGTPELVQVLLDFKAPVNATDANGWTALHFAYSEGRTEAIKMLLEAGADKSITDKEGKTAEQVAATGYKFE
ncbi:Nas6 protein [Starmerella bacillaris]|uniref:Nas6 protein n=1 Tax=Starmerella bacillaris TaxID=1247836 RepID=A0AAV5RJB2_STABA|nr:Nas6 protein [Starmerella bacillaris]